MSFGIFQFRRGTSLEWSTENPVLLDGEMGLDTTVDQFKIGDGVTVWNSLSFAGSAASWGAITGTLSAQTDLQTALNAKQPLATVLTNTTAAFTTAQESKLAGIAAGAEVNVNADWNAVSGDAQILNKPTIPAAYTDEQAQDATGAMVGASIVYNDATPSLQRAALTGAVTSAQDSNTTALGAFTKAQLNTAVSDGDVSFVGDAPTAHTHLLANVTDVTMTVANLNSLDDGANTALHFHTADRDRANHTGTQLSATISDFNSASRAQTEAELIAGANVTITPSGTGATRQLTIATSSSGITAASTDTLTNKTINGASNTLTNIAQSSVTNLTTDLSNKQPLATVLTNTTAAFTTAQETKLSGIATGATANSPDATLLDRANHTGTQTASTISDFNSVARAQVESELIAGINITITPSGAGATRQLTIESTGGSGGATTYSSTMSISPAMYDKAIINVINASSTALSYVNCFLVPNDDNDLDDLIDVDVIAEAKAGSVDFILHSKGAIVGNYKVVYQILG